MFALSQRKGTDKKLARIGLNFTRRLLWLILLVACYGVLLGSLSHSIGRDTKAFVKARAFAVDAPGQAKAKTANRYGATAVVGEPLEPCATPTAIPGVRVLSSTTDWQTALRTAPPGTTL